MKEETGDTTTLETRVGTDNAKCFVGVPTTKCRDLPQSALPRYARLPINRCSVPAAILGSLTYQRHPVPLVLDGVLALHQAFFRRLDQKENAAERASLFQLHMDALFSLEHPEDAGWNEAIPLDRSRANYLRIMRGWGFDADCTEGAVLKGWVESRFGLLPRHHGGPIRDFSGNTYRGYLEQRARGLYGANALEAQLDLLYTYCQYELGRQLLGQTHIVLYRGMNHLNDLEVIDSPGKGRKTVLLNSLSSFTSTRERACEFGDIILKVCVPLAKIAFFHRLLPGRFKGEDEYVVIGGLYEVGFSVE